MTAVPQLYFRIRENGAAVFRLDGDNRDRRLEFEQIAVVNTNQGEVKAHGDHVLTDDEQSVISDWMNARLALLHRRQADDIARLVDQLNLATHWAQSKASDPQLDSVTDELLMAMHDLRNVLLRKKADRVTKADR